MKKSKQLLLITALLFIWELPVIAQQPTDTTYIFRFVPNDDMFYVPWNGNDRSLHQLLNIFGKEQKAVASRANVYQRFELCRIGERHTDFRTHGIHS